jgi:hypothetical protein
MNGTKIGKWYHYGGVIHVHTTESDGTKTLEEVVAIGQQVDLDFILFADHMNLHNKENGKEGYYGNTLAIVGYEHNDPNDNNHYLIYDSPGVYPKEMSVTEYVAAAGADHALGVIAHPDEVRPREGQYPPYPWTDWSVTAFNGIELWNQMSEWMERLTSVNKLLMAFSPRKSMIGPPKLTLERWDALNLQRKVFGIASVDAHAFPAKVGPFTVEIFPYKVHFRSIRTYFMLAEPLSSEFEVAKRQLFEAFRDCRVYCTNVRWGNPLGFSFTASNGISQIIAGGSLKSIDNVTIKVESPSKGLIRLIHNGQSLVDTIAKTYEHQVREAGVYRVEIWKRGRGWIFSNHLRIGME